jgi:hypothetical protein
MEIALVLATLAIPLWLNVKATRLLAGDALSTPGQKIAQLLLVWLVPLIGALVVLAVHRRQEPPSRQYQVQPDPGDDFAASGRAVKKLREAIDEDD